MCHRREFNETIVCWVKWKLTVSKWILFKLFEFLRFHRTQFLRKTFRPSSRPFLSGDTFRKSCHQYVDATADDTIFEKKIFSLTPASYLKKNKSYKLFVDLYFATKPQQISSLLRFFDLNSGLLSDKCILILHNHDIVPDDSFYSRLEQLRIRVFSANISRSGPYVNAVPLGLENRYFLKNGTIHGFKNWISYPRQKQPGSVLCSFRPHTNPAARAPLLERCRNDSSIDVIEDLSPKGHRKALKRYQFVISPPGNGPDCHRTWEAIYLGTIPIVLSGALSSELTKALPVLAVDTWEEFFSWSMEERAAKYDSIISCERTLAYWDYWEDKFSEISSTTNL
jgi:hypothetical protein